MKIALAQLNYVIGDFEHNVARIKETIALAKTREAGLVVFAELSVCGYPPRDFLEFRDFLRQCEESVLSIAADCTGIAAIVGAPSQNLSPKGKPLYNTAWFLADGKVQAKIHKTLLPNYDVFDEYRYFEPNRLPYAVVEYQGHRLALTICEDLWNIADDPLYIRNPMDDLALQGPDVIINIAASPFNYCQSATRQDILVKNALKYKVPVVYVNQVGGQTELIFDGGSMVVNACGEVVASLREFEEEVYCVEMQNVKCKMQRAKGKMQNAKGKGQNEVIAGVLIPSSFESSTSPGAIRLIRQALVLGIRDYFRKMGFSRAILGLSGGIDSAVTMVLAAEALGSENIKAILLPSQFSSGHSVTDAIALAGNLGVSYEIVPIGEAYQSFEKTLEPQFMGLPFGLAEENIQARIRAVILMALSNKFGYILLNTSNKSEAAVGYGTLYGDMCGGLSVLGDVYKTQVYELAKHINSAREVIPLNTITKPPSAELRPDQKDSDSLPAYDILDELLYLYIEQRTGPQELVAAGFDENTVNRVLKLVNTNEYKRFQTPPILRVSPKAFGTGRRMPIVGKYLS